MEYSKETVFSRKELRNNFGYGKIYNIVDKIISKIDFKKITNQIDLHQEISKSVNNNVIFRNDQWEIIKHYSTPKNPIVLEIALDKFTNEIFDCQF